MRQRPADSIGSVVLVLWLIPVNAGKPVESVERSTERDGNKVYLRSSWFGLSFRSCSYNHAAVVTRLMPALRDALCLVAKLDIT